MPGPPSRRGGTPPPGSSRRAPERRGGSMRRLRRGAGSARCCGRSSAGRARPGRGPDRTSSLPARYPRRTSAGARTDVDRRPRRPLPRSRLATSERPGCTVGVALTTGGPVNPNQALWEKGDFGRIADAMRTSGEEFADSLGEVAGRDLLDLGCGDGTTAIPAARRGANVLGVDIARNLVEAGNRRAAEAGLDNVRFVQGDARDLAGIDHDSFDLVVSIFGAMFAPGPDDVAREMVRVARPGGRIVMGNWIPGDPTLVAQILRISSAYSPPPPPGFVSPMTWGSADTVAERFTAAGVPAANIHCQPATWTFDVDGAPSEFLHS